ncbi:AAA family ATPase [Niabella aquatica]
MIQIEAIKVVIHTNTGAFGRMIEFKKGLNIIRANNTSGKSSLFGALLYGFGFEEILGSRNEKALQSVFKSIVKELINNNGQISEKENFVIQSEIYLQFSNGKETITTKRFVVNEKIKPQAVEVFFGTLITTPGVELRRQPMYIHDKGGASNEDVGFHRFLEEFIGAELPEIINQDGKRVKLFLPLISAAHFIEQKAGWSDFYANIPYYEIRDASAKVFEYILNFDVFETAAKRQEIQNKLKEINDDWNRAVNNINSSAKRGGSEVIGIPNAPEILSQDTKPYLRFTRGDKSLLLTELITTLNEDLKEAKEQLHVPINNNIERIENELDKLKINTERYELVYENLSSEVSQDRERLRQYLAQLNNVEEDLRKNKDAEKLQKIGLDSNIKISNSICPTCNQRINDTLLTEHLHFVPMRIDENISYLHAQRKMIAAFVSNLKTNISQKDIKIEGLEKAIQGNRQRIRSLKKTLVSDDRLPSEEVIERKVILERELSFLYRLREEFELLLSDLYRIGQEYQKAKSLLINVSNSYLSSSDAYKLKEFEEYFKSLLQKFGFTSKPVNTIKISPEKYLPVYEIRMANDLIKQVDIRFESSASDFIRAQWAYYTTLINTSIECSGNHFLILIFDEPQQQSAATENFRVFLSELEQYRNQQVIVLASFQNSDEDFKEATQDLAFTNIIDLASQENLFIQRELKNNDTVL